MASERSNEPAGDQRRFFSSSLLLKVCLTGLVLWLVGRSIHASRLVTLVADADLILLLFAVTYTVALNGIKPFRWLWLLRGVLPQTTYATALRSTLFGAGARLVLPSKLGEFGRVLEVPDLKLLTGVGLTALDLLMEASAAFLVAVPGALIFLGPVGATFALFLTLVPLLALFYPHRVLLPLARLPVLKSFRDRLIGAEQIVNTLGRGVILRGLFVSVVLNGIRFSQLYVIFVALGTVPNAAAVLCFPLIQLADGFPLTIGGVGVREWLGMAVLPAYGILPEAAVAAVFLQFAISNLLPGAVGWWIIFRGRHAAGQRLKAALAEVRSSGDTSKR